MERLGEEFERIMLPHARSLLRFALRQVRDAATAEDLVQETLLLAWRSYRQFEAGTNARAWLFRILINASHARNRKLRNTPPPMPLTPDMSVASGFATEKLELTQALDRLIPDQRIVLLLAVVEGFTCKEIAGILTIPIGTVMSRLGRARIAMRESLSPVAGRQGEEVTR